MQIYRILVFYSSERGVGGGGKVGEGGLARTSKGVLGQVGAGLGVYRVTGGLWGGVSFFLFICLQRRRSLETSSFLSWQHP